MALRTPLTLAAKRATFITPATCRLSPSSSQWRGNATVAPQPTPGSKGPTAMVFMNMGGPSTTDEVHGFLSMLFVRISTSNFRVPGLTFQGRQRSHSSRTFPELHWTVHRAKKNAQDPEAICRDWWRVAHQEMVRISGGGNVQNPRQDVARNCASQAICCFPLC